MKSTLLIVDDSPSLHKLIQVYLDSDSINIHSAYCGKEGILEAIRLRPNLILLDLDMPEMDGFEVCRQLKADSATETFPVIFLTANTSPEKQIEGLRLGATDFMTKQIKPVELSTRVRAALRARVGAESNTMVDGVTGLWNKTYLDLHLPGYISHARRANFPLACAVADIDHLKTINRNYGDAIGNQLLRSVGQILISQGRIEDTIGYIENGKFMMLLPATSSAGAANLAERIRSEIELQLMACHGMRVDTTCSFGISDTHTGPDSSLFARADTALYCAKRAGRNCISVSAPMPLEIRTVA